MKLFALTLTLIFLSLLLPAQKNHTSLVVSLGPSYSFNMPGMIDRSGAVGINYVFSKKNRAVIFNPGLNAQINVYRTKISSYRRVHTNQQLLNLTLDVLMRVSKQNHLRAGLFINQVYFTNVTVWQKPNNANIYGYGSSELEKDYSAAALQAGFTLGFVTPFKLFKRENKFNIKAMHIVSPLVNHDYRLTQNQVGEDLTVLSAKKRPTTLIFAFEFNLQKREKVKQEAEE